MAALKAKALSLSTMVRVAADGLQRLAPEEGLESVRETVSLLSSELSSVIGMETVFEVSPSAKLTVWLASV